MCVCMSENLATKRSHERRSNHSRATSEQSLALDNDQLCHSFLYMLNKLCPLSTKHSLAQFRKAYFVSLGYALNCISEDIGDLRYWD